MNHPLLARYVPGMTDELGAGRGAAAIWAHEARRCRPSTLALPVLSTVMIIGVSVLIRTTTTTSARDAGVGMVRLTADLFPVTAGLAACMAVASDRLLELHHSLPTPYPTTAVRRLLLIGLSTLVGAILTVTVLAAAGHWNSPAGGVLAPVIPLAPAVFLGGVALWAQARVRSTAAASTTVVAAWLAQLAIFDRFVALWTVNRILLIAAGVCLAVAGWRRLGDGEAALHGSDR